MKNVCVACPPTHLSDHPPTRVMQIALRCAASEGLALGTYSLATKQPRCICKWANVEPLKYSSSRLMTNLKLCVPNYN